MSTIERLANEIDASLGVKPADWSVLCETLAPFCKAHDALMAALRGLELRCLYDVLNPCWGDRPTDVPGKHWGGGTACGPCTARAALNLAEPRESNPDQKAAADELAVAEQLDAEEAERQEREAES